MGFVKDSCLFGKLTEEVIGACVPYRCTDAEDIDSFFIWIIRITSLIIHQN